MKDRWRAEKGGTYYSVDSDKMIIPCTDTRSYSDDYSYNLGNYFETLEQAKKLVNSKEFKSFWNECESFWKKVRNGEIKKLNEIIKENKELIK